MNSYKKRRAFALVLVLIALVLTTSMAVFFLTSVARERLGVNLYATGGEVHHLAGMPVSRVMGQINTATKEGTIGNPVSWASQPGMIRTFSVSGPANVYKLYSWDTIPVQKRADYDPSSADESAPSDWRSNPAIYTDLNQVINGVYPIVDPSAEGPVEGFSITKTAAAITGSGLEVPMPVKWLYVLQDGRIVAPTPVSAGVVAVADADKNNPIIGRIAYWTDDETCKVNINTASEGAFWDWPKAATFNEMQFAGNPPVGGEFNRTPGHPAMTSLSAVLSESTFNPGDRWANMGNYRTRLAALLKMTPRVPYSDASSRGGTYPIELENFVYGPKASQTIPPIPGAALALKSDRLFVSADEFIFDPGRSNQPGVTPSMVSQRAFFLTSQSRAPETTLFETPRISLWPITWSYKSAHAQLPNRQTADVTSPDPDKESLSNNKWMRAEEKLLAFTATLGKQLPGGGAKYYFQRQNPESPTHDYTNITRNKDVLKYLQLLTSKDIPGFGGNFAAKETVAGRDAVLANAFNVVRSLVNQYTIDPKPNSKGNFGSMLYAFTPVSFARFKAKDDTIVKPYNESGAYSPIPLKINLGSGEVTTLSEFPLLREAALVFYATARDIPEKPVIPAALQPVSGEPHADAVAKKQKINAILANPYNWKNLINLSATGYENATPGVTLDDIGARTTQMRAFLALDFSPVRGSTRNNQPVFWVKLRGASFVAKTGKGTADIDFGSATAKMDFRAGVAPTFMLSMYTRDTTTGKINGIKTFNNGDVSDANYGLISSPIPVDPTDVKFEFTGNKLFVEIYGIKDGNPNTDPTANTDLLIASYEVDFSSWGGNQKVPLAPYWNFMELPELASAPEVNPEPYYPNPNFKNGYKPAAPLPPGAIPAETRETSWAAMEIAPPYRSGTGSGDPAVTASPGTVWGYSGLYVGSTASPCTNPVDGSLNSHVRTNVWGYPALYAYADTTGPLMIDLTRRMKFSNTGAGRAPLAVDSNARNSGSLLTTPRDDVFGQGFPTINAYDTVLSVIVDPGAADSGDGDPRLALKAKFKSAKSLLEATVPATPLRQVLKDSEYPLDRPRQYHTLGSRRNTGYIIRSTHAMLGTGIAPNGMALLGGVNKPSILGDPGNTTNDGDAIGVASSQLQFKIPVSSSVGDWSSSPGIGADGGVLVRPDQDTQSLIVANTITGQVSGFTHQTPYFRQQVDDILGFDTTTSIGYFSANRQIPSPITLFGGLPSSQTQGWQTLAFSPNPAAVTAGGTHPGIASSPPDHLLLDLFWMPVAEPYPISEEFSTAGKINLNYEIVPFNYIKRRTGLHALMKSTWITALNNSLVQYYKSHYAMGDTLLPTPHAVPNSTSPGTIPNRQTRYKIDVKETLDLFDKDVFGPGDVFRSASQLCSMWLVPEGRKAGDVKSFWDDKVLTSDTAREQPYDHLYSRVTTKSNTFTVHWRVQSLRKSQITNAGQWDEVRDRTVSELRGSTLIERYIDSNALDIPDYADPAVIGNMGNPAAANPTKNLSNFYKWRVVSENYFQP